jgi:signal peptidase I
MMARIQTLIFYAACIVLLLVVYHFATSFAFAIVDEGYRYMEPKISSRETVLVDKRRGTVRELAPDDVIVYETVYRKKSMRMFGRVVATSGMTLTVRKNRLMVEGSDAAPAPKVFSLLKTGVMVPRETVFVIFDSPDGDRVSISQRVVPFRNIIGRVIGQ